MLDGRPEDFLGSEVQGVGVLMRVSGGVWMDGEEEWQRWMEGWGVRNDGWDVTHALSRRRCL